MSTEIFFRCSQCGADLEAAEVDSVMGHGRAQADEDGDPEQVHCGPVKKFVEAPAANPVEGVDLEEAKLWFDTMQPKAYTRKLGLALIAEVRALRSSPPGRAWWIYPSQCALDGSIGMAYQEKQGEGGILALEAGGVASKVEPDMWCPNCEYLMEAKEVEGDLEPLRETLRGPSAGEVVEAARDFVWANRHLSSAKGQNADEETVTALESEEDATWTNICMAVDAYETALEAESSTPRSEAEGPTPSPSHQVLVVGEQPWVGKTLSKAAEDGAGEVAEGVREALERERQQWQAEADKFANPGSSTAGTYYLGLVKGLEKALAALASSPNTPGYKAQGVAPAARPMKLTAGVEYTQTGRGDSTVAALILRGKGWDRRLEFHVNTAKEIAYRINAFEGGRAEG